MAITVETYENGKTVTETTHVGLVLGTGEYNGYDDSDFYAVVWDPIKQRTDRVTYATTRAWTYNNHAEVDFDTEKYGADYNAYCKRCKLEQALDELQRLYGSVRDIDRIVKVVRGRKVPIGTVGTVVAVWANPYDMYNQQYLIQVGNVRLCTYRKNLEVVVAQEDIDATTEMIMK